MPNRHQRRAQNAGRRGTIRAARLRCVACERVNQPMTGEHMFPLWLIDYCDVRRDGIAWAGQDSGANPRTATVPLCEACNHRLGSELEDPVSRILPRLEAGHGITDREAELLVRWLWKFEGLGVCYARLGLPGWRYSDRWTLIERILGDPPRQVRHLLTLAIGLTNQNDPEHEDWPMGLDHGASGLDGFFVSGVFRKTALMVTLSRFADMIPPWYGTYQLGSVTDPAVACFVPPVCFPFSADAIGATKRVSLPLKKAHEDFALEHQARRPVTGVRPQLIIPNR